MANLKIDLSLNKVFQREENTKTYIYKDIGTENFHLLKDKDGNPQLYDINTSNYNENAVTASLNNLFNFRLRTRNFRA
jgi:hypothetical protein